MTNEELNEIEKKGCFWGSSKCDSRIRQIVTEIRQLQAENKRHTRTIEETLGECHKWRMTDAEMEDLLK